MRINDRLPKSSLRIIDLSRGAATVLDMRTVGVVRVKLELETIQDMNRLYDQMEGFTRGTIRIRRYEEAILPGKRAISWHWPI